MRTVPKQPVSTAVRWAREWQRLSLTASNQAMGCYLRGCADLTMSRTPKHAWDALYKTQCELLGHAMDTYGEATKLWRA
jgi:hypothetical protein